jgi:hypothetical protein
MKDASEAVEHEDPVPVQPEPIVQAADPKSAVATELVQVDGIIQVKYPAPDPAPNALIPGNIKYCVIHHTAGGLNQTPLDIDAEERPTYSMMPYQLLCTQEGLVYAGRPLQYESAATYGLNHASVSIVAIGNYQSNDSGFTGMPTQKLLDAIVQAGVYLHKKFPTIEQTIGHSDAGVMEGYGTACPGNLIEVHLQWIKGQIYAALHP